MWDMYALENEGMSSDLMKYKPKGRDTYSFEELMNLNPDVIGWITIDDTHIDQPITIGEDDMDYVNKNALGKYSMTGSIFMDSDNHQDFSDPYNLSYGHHVENGGMYGDLEHFLKQDYFDSHTSGTLYAPYSDAKEFDLEILAVMEVSAYDSKIYNPVPYQTQKVGSLLDYIEQNQIHSRDLGLTLDDQIFCLSTCKDAQSEERIVVFAKMSEAKMKESETRQWIN